MWYRVTHEKNTFYKLLSSKESVRDLASFLACSSSILNKSLIVVVLTESYSAVEYHIYPTIR
jgi:hypothetical protein